MATVDGVKQRMLDKLAAMDLNKMTLMDANLYVDVLKKLSDISETSYADRLADVLARGMGNANAGYALARLGDTDGGDNDVQ